MIAEEEGELPALQHVPATRFGPAGAAPLEDAVVEEVPVALVYNGISHAVMLATPTDLEDFALGFSLSEGLIASPAELLEVEVVVSPAGVELQLRVTAERFQGFKATRRQLAGRTGCGLCGRESLDQAILPVPSVPEGLVVDAAALTRAIAALPAAQGLHRQSGGVHAAAWANPDGAIRLVREDVGRHNALDKLLGALRRQRVAPADGFVLITSRASHELVHKAASAGVQLLAAVSAPTAMAVRNAQTAGLTLVGWLRERGFSVYAGAGRIAGPEKEKPERPGGRSG